MDERQAQIRERAGLEESRLNLEFIDWLRKWGTPILIAAALLAGAFTVRERYQKSKSAEVDSAFQELEAARAGGNASPDALLAVADDFEGVRAVSILARLEAADAYMDAVRRGTKPGAPVDAQGALTSAEDVLNDADRDQFLTKAEALYKQVEGETSSNPSQVPLTLGTLYGQAAVVESRGDYDAARGFYERVIALADAAGYPVNSPRAAAERAGTVTINPPHAYEISRALLARDIVIDYREGAGIRIAPHFYNTDDEVQQVMDATAAIIADGSWQEYGQGRSFVT